MDDPEKSNQGEEEFVPEDDAIIGIALRWSLLVLVVIGSIVAAVILLRRGPEEREEVVEKEMGPIENLVIDTETMPNVRFTDVTSEAGIDFVHFNGATGQKYLPETMGGGAAFFDYDGDGDQDLFFVNGRSWVDESEGGKAPGHRLYANDGSGHFMDVTDASGLPKGGYGMGVATGDYDGDGRVDLFVTGIGGNHLYRNLADGFVDATTEAGVGGGSDAWTTSAGFFDYDGDRDLDLFVCSYVRWSKEIDGQLAYTLNGTDRAYGPPTSYKGSFSMLFRNEGDGTFRDVSEPAGIDVVNPATKLPMGKALGVGLADFDEDGWMDIVVANDTVQNHFFHNEGDGHFEEVGASIGIGLDGSGESTGAMGMDVGDFRGDGGLGVCIGNFANEMSSLYVSHGDSLIFSDEAMAEGIGSPSRQFLSFGVFFFDYDLDGRLDLLQVNGHLEETINEVQPSQHYLQRPQLFWNAGPDERTCFREVPAEMTADLDQKLAGRGSTYADIDGDGDLDILILQAGAAPHLLRNDQDLGHHWLRIQLKDRGPNRDAIGAWVRVVPKDESGETFAAVRRHVRNTCSYLSQCELPLTFGLGTASEIEAIEVTWPDGSTEQCVPPVGVDRTLTIERGE